MWSRHGEGPSRKLASILIAAVFATAAIAADLALAAPHPGGPGPAGPGPAHPPMAPNIHMGGPAGRCDLPVCKGGGMEHLGGPIGPIGLPGPRDRHPLVGQPHPMASLDRHPMVSLNRVCDLPKCKTGVGPGHPPSPNPAVVSPMGRHVVNANWNHWCDMSAKCQHDHHGHHHHHFYFNNFPYYNNSYDFGVTSYYSKPRQPHRSVGRGVDTGSDGSGFADPTIRTISRVNARQPALAAGAYRPRLTDVRARCACAAPIASVRLAL